MQNNCLQLVLARLAELARLQVDSIHAGQMPRSNVSGQMPRSNSSGQMPRSNVSGQTAAVK